MKLVRKHRASEAHCAREGHKGDVLLCCFDCLNSCGEALGVTESGDVQIVIGAGNGLFAAVTACAWVLLHWDYFVLFFPLAVLKHRIMTIHSTHGPKKTICVCVTVSGNANASKTSTVISVIHVSD